MFSKLLQKAGIKTEKGVGFYTLRRTAATLAARSGDPFAVQRLLGHVDLKMAATYVQDVSEQTNRIVIVNNVRKLIIQDDSSPSVDASNERNERFGLEAALLLLIQGIGSGFFSLCGNDLFAGFCHHCLLCRRL